MSEPTSWRTHTHVLKGHFRSVLVPNGTAGLQEVSATLMASDMANVSTAGIGLGSERPVALKSSRGCTCLSPGCHAARRQGGPCRPNLAHCSRNTTHLDTSACVQDMKQFRVSCYASSTTIAVCIDSIGRPIDCQYTAYSVGPAFRQNGDRGQARRCLWGIYRAQAQIGEK